MLRPSGIDRVYNDLYFTLCKMDLDFFKKVSTSTIILYINYIILYYTSITLTYLPLPITLKYFDILPQGKFNLRNWQCLTSSLKANKIFNRGLKFFENRQIWLVFTFFIGSQHRLDLFLQKSMFFESQKLVARSLKI